MKDANEKIVIQGIKNQDLLDLTIKNFLSGNSTKKIALIWTVAEESLRSYLENSYIHGYEKTHVKLKLKHNVLLNFIEYIKSYRQDIFHIIPVMPIKKGKALQIQEKENIKSHLNEGWIILYLKEPDNSLESDLGQIQKELKQNKNYLTVAPVLHTLTYYVKKALEKNSISETSIFRVTISSNYGLDIECPTFSQSTICHELAIYGAEKGQISEIDVAVVRIDYNNVFDFLKYYCKVPEDSIKNCIELFIADRNNYNNIIAHSLDSVEITKDTGKEIYSLSEFNKLKLDNANGLMVLKKTLENGNSGSKRLMKPFVLGDFEDIESCRRKFFNGNFSANCNDLDLTKVVDDVVCVHYNSLTKKIYELCRGVQLSDILNKKHQDIYDFEENLNEHILYEMSGRSQNVIILKFWLYLEVALLAYLKGNYCIFSMLMSSLDNAQYQLRHAFPMDIYSGIIKTTFTFLNKRSKEQQELANNGCYYNENKKIIIPHFISYSSRQERIKDDKKHNQTLSDLEKTTGHFIHYLNHKDFNFSYLDNGWLDMKISECNKNFALSEFESEDVEKLKKLVSPSFLKIQNIDLQKFNYREIDFTYAEIIEIKKRLAQIGSSDAKRLGQKLKNNLKFNNNPISSDDFINYQNFAKNLNQYSIATKIINTYKSSAKKMKVSLEKSDDDLFSDVLNHDYDLIRDAEYNSIEMMAIKNNDLKLLNVLLKFNFINFDHSNINGENVCSIVANLDDQDIKKIVRKKIDANSIEQSYSVKNPEAFKSSCSSSGQKRVYPDFDYSSRDGSKNFSKKSGKNQLHSSLPQLPSSTLTIQNQQINSNESSVFTFQSAKIETAKPLMKINRKGLASVPSENLKKLLDLPDDLMPGSAVDDGGCFFDGLAQALNAIQNTINYTEKHLRQLCYQYYNDHIEEMDELIKEDYNGTNNSQDYTFVRYTKKELDRIFHGESPIWGRPHIEGVILCKMLKLNAIHLIELMKISENSELIIVHSLITRERVSQISGNKIPSYRQKIPVLVLGQQDLHFIPILPNQKIEIYDQKNFESYAEHIPNSLNVSMKQTINIVQNTGNLSKELKTNQFNQQVVPRRQNNNAVNQNAIGQNRNIIFPGSSSSTLQPQVKSRSSSVSVSTINPSATREQDNYRKSAGK